MDRKSPIMVGKSSFRLFFLVLIMTFIRSDIKGCSDSSIRNDFFFNLFSAETQSTHRIPPSRKSVPCLLSYELLPIQLILLLEREECQFQQEFLSRSSHCLDLLLALRSEGRMTDRKGEFIGPSGGTNAGNLPSLSKRALLP
jgi:hypothetical protein